MTKETNKAGAVRPEHGIGSRPRQPSETTYGFPNHEDGIQSVNSGDGDASDPAGPKDRNTAQSGPGATHSNGMKGQK